SQRTFLLWQTSQALVDLFLLYLAVVLLVSDRSSMGDICGADAVDIVLLWSLRFCEVEGFCVPSSEMVDLLI
ncbi:hypothetical protein WICPIJ_002922, partial [Wickerhamomyces pijperi]